MSAGNAFSQASNGYSANRPDGNGSEQGPSARQPRLAVQACDVETGLEVDHMILDFLVYQSQQACLQSRRCEDGGRDTLLSLKHNIAMTDHFLQVFRARHPSIKPDRELRFRIDLLNLTAQFVQRLSRNPLTPSNEALQELRDRNLERVRAWIGSAERIPSLPWARSMGEKYDTQLPLPAPELEQNRAHVLYVLDVPAEEHGEDAFYGTADCVPLLEILPLFMRVSAARNALAESTVTEDWLHLAAGFMIQACLEQYLVFGASGTDAIDAAFAWGYKDAEDFGSDARIQDPQSASSHAEMNEMFSDPQYATEHEAWRAIKTNALEQFFPRPASFTSSLPPSSCPNLREVLETAASSYPPAEFERQIFAFLTALSDSLDLPALVQVQRGQLTGMTPSETQEFLRTCGFQASAALLR